jgi:two-component system, NarL family, response regulator NreC
VHLPNAQESQAESSAQRVRCVLVDEQVLVREGIGRLLREQPGFELMGEGASFQEAMKQAGYLPPDVVVVGADQDRHAALEAARLARLDYPNAQLVFLLTYLDEAYRAQCERAGVLGFVLKTAPSEALTEVLVEAYRAGQKSGVGGPVLVENARLLAQRRGGSRNLQVTRREEEVLRLIAEGNSARSAAAVLGLSVKTVEAHKFNFMRKLGLHNRAQVINYALRKGLVRVPVAE